MLAYQYGRYLRYDNYVSYVNLNFFCDREVASARPAKKVKSEESVLWSHTRLLTSDQDFAAISHL